MTILSRFVSDESGATAIEYALVAVGVITAPGALQVGLSDMFGGVGALAHQQGAHRHLRPARPG